jgi:hypothetical protein
VLAQNLVAYREAAATSRAIQQGLVEQADPATPNFLARYPYFVTNGRGVPIAQVFHYGVWDAVHAPFVDAPRDVYPLPQLDGAELVPVRLGAPASRIFVWDAVARRVREATPLPAPPMPVELDVLTGGSPGIAVRTSPEMAARFRLIVVARGNAAVVELASDAVHDGVLRAALPEEFCRAMVQLYGDHEMFWWIEGRDAGGVVSAFTRLRAFRWSE